MFCRLNGSQQQFGTISSQRTVIAERLDDGPASSQPSLRWGSARRNMCCFLNAAGADGCGCVWLCPRVYTSRKFRWSCSSTNLVLLLLEKLSHVFFSVLLSHRMCAPSCAVLAGAGITGWKQSCKSAGYLWQILWRGCKSWTLHPSSLSFSFPWAMRLLCKRRSFPFIYPSAWRPTWSSSLKKPVISNQRAWQTSRIRLAGGWRGWCLCWVLSRVTAGKWTLEGPAIEEKLYLMHLSALVWQRWTPRK